MFYENFTAERFFSEITDEAAARTLLWRSRFAGKEFECPSCKNQKFYEIKTRPEVRTCKACLKQTRLRAGTMIQCVLS